MEILRGSLDIDLNRTPINRKDENEIHPHKNFWPNRVRFTVNR